MKTIIAAAALVASATLAVVTGCSPEPVVATDEAPRPAATVNRAVATPGVKPSPKAPPAAVAAKRFVEALASNDPEQARAGLTHTAKGSVAAAYLAHQANLYEAELDSGVSVEPSTVAGFKMCSSYDSGSCHEFGGFVADASGKLTDLTVNGKAVKSRITVGDGKVVEAEGGHRFEFLTAYKAITSDTLWISIKVTSGDQPLRLDIYDAPYRAPNGKLRQPDVEMTIGLTELEPESNTIIALAYPSATPGGRVTFTGCVNDCEDEYEAVVKVG